MGYYIYEVYILMFFFLSEDKFFIYNFEGILFYGFFIVWVLFNRGFKCDLFCFL